MIVINNAMVALITSHSGNAVNRELLCIRYRELRDTREGQEDDGVKSPDLSVDNDFFNNIYIVVRKMSQAILLYVLVKLHIEIYTELDAVT